MRDEGQVQEVEHPENADEHAHECRIPRRSSLIVDESLNIRYTKEPKTIRSQPINTQARRKSRWKSPKFGYVRCREDESDEKRTEGVIEIDRRFRCYGLRG